MLARSARALLARRHLPAVQAQATRGLLVRKGKRPAEESSALVKAGDAWVAVKDKETGAHAHLRLSCASAHAHACIAGLTYWWNERTSQTTAVGAPRPTGARLIRCLTHWVAR